MKKSILFPAAAVTAAALLIPHRRAEAKFDAVTAASLTVKASSITSTSAVILYSKDKYDYGTRTLCYDPSPAAPVDNCTTKNAKGNSGSFSISGLKAGTKYNFSVKAVDDTPEHEKPYTSTGSFTTLTATGVVTMPAVKLLPEEARAFDASGRSLPAQAVPHSVAFPVR